MALGKGLKFEDLWRSKCVCVRVCVVQGFPNVTSVFRRFGYEPVVVLRRTWTPKVCRIIAFYRFWGHYFTYFCGSRFAVPISIIFGFNAEGFSSSSAKSSSLYDTAPQGFREFRAYCMDQLADRKKLWPGPQKYVE